LRSRIQTIVRHSPGSFDPRYTVERIEQHLRLRGDLDRAARRDRIAELIELVGWHRSGPARFPAVRDSASRLHRHSRRNLTCWFVPSLSRPST